MGTGITLATGIVMKSSRRRVQVPVRVDRRRADEDVFEHVIWGVRVNRILQMLRDVGALNAERRAYQPSASSERRH